MLRVVFFSCLLWICSCTPTNRFQDQSPTSRRTLEAQKGTPRRIYQTPSGQDVYEYENEERFQMHGDHVTHHYRNPLGPEVHLQYWLNRWKGDIYHFTPIGETQGDMESQLHYINYDNNESFIYDPSLHRVLRVIFEVQETEKRETSNK